MFQSATAWPCLAFLALPMPVQEAGTTDGFQNPELLVSCEWLDEHREDEGLVVVDVRKAKEYAEGHVPGAVHLATSETFDPERMGDLATPELIAERLGARGIESGTHVVLYDWGKSTSAARVLWTLELYGHSKVSVVDGGFVKWKADELEVSVDAPEVKALEYELGEPTERLSTKAIILDDVGDEQCVMLDARSKREFDSGRIPAAVHIEWTDNFTGDDVPVFLSPAKLRALYAERGVTKDKRVHAY